MAKIKKVIGANPYRAASDSDGLVILYDDGTVKAFGGATSIAGLLNEGRATMMIDLPLKEVSNIYGNSETAFFVMGDGSVKCFGYNRTRVFGVGTSNEYIKEFTTIPGITDVKEIILYVNDSYKDGRVFVLHNDGSVSGCGSNRGGVFGDGTGVAYTEFKSLPINNITTGASSTNKVTRIFAGDSVWYEKEPAIGRTNRDTIFGCGNNIYGRLGVNSADAYVFIPKQINCSIDVGIKEIIPQYNITYFIMDTDLTSQLFYSGNTRYQGINVVEESKTIKRNTKFTHKLKTIKYTSPNNYGGNWYYILADGHVNVLSSSGGNSYLTGLGETAAVLGQYYTIPDLENVTDAACTSNFSTYFLLEDGTVKTCGDNSSGQLGLNDMENRKSVALISDLPHVREMQPINSKAIAFITEDDEIYVCGDNTYQSLGLGTNTTNVKIPTLLSTMPLHYLYLQGNSCYREEKEALLQVTSNWGTLSEAEKKALFVAATCGVPNLSSLSDLGAFEILAFKESTAAMNAPTCRLTAIATERLVTPKGLIPIQNFEGIDKATLTVTTGGQGSCKVLVTTDRAAYQSYDFAAQTWKAVDHTDIAAVKASGIDAAQLTNIPRAAWDTLTAGKDGIGFAYLPSIESTSDVCSVDELTLQVDMRGTWERASETDYTYAYPNNTTLRVTLKTDGDYKINYQR